MSQHRQQRRRRPGRWHPALGAAAIVAVAIVAYVSYNALTGLPWQSRYHVTVDVPSAQRLITTNDVRIGGIRVGQVKRVDARPADDGGRPFARVSLALDRSVGRLPVDTTAAIRPASVLGATYVDLTLGTSAETVPDGGTLARRSARAVVDLVDLFRVFDGRARRDFRAGVRGLADGLAGRGSAVNETIGSLAAMMPPLTRVMDTLASRDADVPGFVRGWRAAVSALAPAAHELGGLTSGLAGTFDALAAADSALGRAIAIAPQAEREAATALTVLRPTLDDGARLMADLRPAARTLPRALARANRAMASGTTALRVLPRVSAPLSRAMGSLAAVSRRSSTGGALRKLAELMSATDPMLATLADAQLYCNALPLLGQNYSSYIGLAGVGDGPAFWNLTVSTPGAQTDAIQSAEQAPDLRVNYTPNENSQECESNNEPAASRKVIGNPPGLQSRTTRDTEPPPGVQQLAVRAGLTDDYGRTP